MTNLSNAEWRKSSYSGNNGGNCVEVASNLTGIVAVRDSKNRGGPVPYRLRSGRLRAARCSELFRALCLGFEHAAFRLETQERYVDDEEQEPLRRFLAGEPPDDEWFMDWYEAVARLAAGGRRMERVRVVDEPHSDYTRFGIDLARRLNVQAGEDIRYLPRQRAEGLGLPGEDFWLLDSSRVLTLHFDAEMLLGAELVTDPAAVVQHAYWRDAAWHHAIPVDEYAGT
jgi:uncharacterized protein DUF6879/uncharacterized protein DUF397